MSRTKVREQTSSIRNWWANVQQEASIFFDLIQSPPSDRANLNVTGAMVDLHDAQRAVQKMICPLEAEGIRAYLLESMRMLQISLADLLAHDAEASDISFGKACGHYNQALDHITRCSGR
jgi:hypothetical protein